MNCARSIAVFCVMGGLSVAASQVATPPGSGLRTEIDSSQTRAEQRLQRLLKRTSQELRRARKSAQSWRERIQQVDRLLAQIETLEGQYNESRRLLGQRSGNLVAQQQLQQQQGQLSRQLGELRLLLKQKQHETDSPLYRAAREHAAARAELVARWAAVKGAARQVDHEARRPSVEQVGKRVAEVLETDELPLWLAQGHVRVLSVIDGQPATFVVDGDYRQTLLPRSQADRLGIDVPEVGWQEVPYGERTLKAVSLKVPSLQVGPATLSDHPVYVTTSADAELGPRLGTDAMDELGIQIDRARARILVGPKRTQP